METFLYVLMGVIFLGIIVYFFAPTSVGSKEEPPKKEEEPNQNQHKVDVNDRLW